MKLFSSNFTLLTSFLKVMLVAGREKFNKVDDQMTRNKEFLIVPSATEVKVI
jgi:hypothetical protein